MSNSTQFSDFSSSVKSNLDEFTSFNGFTMFSYVVREAEGHKGPFHYQLSNKVFSIVRGGRET